MSNNSTPQLQQDSKSPKNWCDLPQVAKLNCIRTMDFLARSHLHCTARSERLLVDSLRYNFDLVVLGDDYCDFRRGEDQDQEEIVITKDKDLHLAVSALNQSDIDYLSVNSDEMFKKLEKSIKSLSVNTMEISCEFKSMMRILKKIRPKIDFLLVDFNYQLVKIEKFLAIPAVKALPIMEVHNLELGFDTRQIEKFVKSWSESAEIGAKLRIMTIRGFFEEENADFNFNFGKEISHKDNKWRYEIDVDPKRNVLKVIQDPFQRCFVIIPSDLEPEEHHTEFKNFFYKTY